jgi:hypothetical protein
MLVCVPTVSTLQFLSFAVPQLIPCLCSSDLHGPVLVLVQVSLVSVMWSLGCIQSACGAIDWQMC